MIENSKPWYILMGILIYIKYWILAVARPRDLYKGRIFVCSSPYITEKDTNTEYNSGRPWARAMDARHTAELF